MKITWMLGMLLAALLAGGAGGWVVKGWKVGHDQNAATQTMARAAAQQALVLNQQNEANAKRTAALLVTLEGQAHAFAKLDAYLAAHPMGQCSFDPATDGLWSGAYDAAFGADQAGGGDAKAGAPGPATRPPKPTPQGPARQHQLPVVPGHD